MRRTDFLPALLVVLGAAGFAYAANPAPKPAVSPATAKPTASGSAVTIVPNASQKPDTTKPISVNSDKLFADIKANIGIYTGHVIVTQDTLKMSADEVKVFTASGKPQHLEAHGNVVFVSPSGNATGEFGIYDIGKHLVTLTGKDVVVVRDKNVMHGTKLEVHTDTSEAHLYSIGQNNGRVQGLFTPPPKDNTAQPAQTPQKSGSGQPAKP